VRGGRGLPGGPRRRPARRRISTPSPSSATASRPRSWPTIRGTSLGSGAPGSLSSWRRSTRRPAAATSRARGRRPRPSGISTSGPRRSGRRPTGNLPSAAARRTAICPSRPGTSWPPRRRRPRTPRSGPVRNEASSLSPTPRRPERRGSPPLHETVRTPARAAGSSHFRLAIRCILARESLPGLFKGGCSPGFRRDRRSHPEVDPVGVRVFL
jgi:hypothetical protein